MVIDEYFSEFKDGENEQRGIKEVSLFQSALYEPQQTFNRKELYPDVLSKAAVYLRSFALNHAFCNGNKRTALMAMIVFLDINGYQVIVKPNDLYRLALTVVLTKPSIDVINRKYIRKYTRYVGSRRNAFLSYFYDLIAKI